MFADDVIDIEENALESETAEESEAGVEEVLESEEESEEVQSELAEQE